MTIGIQERTDRFALHKPFSIKRLRTQPHFKKRRALPLLKTFRGCQRRWELGKSWSAPFLWRFDVRS
jgi:hypothetical protein